MACAKYWPLVFLLVGCSSSSDSTGVPTTSAGGGGGASGAAGSAGTGATSTEGGADTWSSFAEEFFAKYCVSCHDGGPNVKGDFRKMTDVQQHSPDIRCGIATSVLAGCAQSHYPPRQFPIGTGPKPTDAERERIVAWIDAGLPP